MINSRRAGFTLIELLVVIAVIAVLIALLMPAVQKVRAAAARAQCANNLKQIALAVHNYHDSHKKLPTGRYGDYTAWTAWGGPFEDSMSWSWLADILPFLEQNNVYTSGGIPTTPLNASSATAASITTFLCPSDDASGQSPTLQISHYLRSPGLIVGLSNYKGVMGDNFCWGTWANGNPCEPWERGNGMFFSMAWQHRRTFSIILDGTSNTFMVGEMTYNPKVPRDGQYGQGFSWAHATEACMSAAIPPNAREPSGAEFDPADPLAWQKFLGPRSRHHGGVQFAMADGSCHFISDTIALGLYRALATVGGGEPGSLP